MPVHDVVLSGCDVEPVMSYVKALGVFRIVSEQRDGDATGHWGTDGFHIGSCLDVESLVAFLLNDYHPTPLVAPWNGGSGFYKGGKNGTLSPALSSILDSESERLSDYRTTISTTREIIREAGVTNKPDEKKIEILRLCRCRLPDNIIPWLDSVYVLAKDKPDYAPILGTGGNDGNFEFTSNYVQRLERVILGNGKKKAKEWLEASLYGIGDVKLISMKDGQCRPGGGEAPNASQGFKANSIVNPWDFIFMMEGMLSFAGAASRRLGSQSRGRSSAAFPFQVDPSDAGWGSLATGEGFDSKRGELWLPVWHNPATYAEMKYTFSEGRAEVGRRAARNGTDFARAAVMLGVDRGISNFRRFGFLVRSGKANLAVPLGGIQVEPRREASLLEDIDKWTNRLSRFRNPSGAGRNAPQSIRELLRDLDRVVFGYCRYGGARWLQEVMIAVSRVELALQRASSLRDKMSPFPGLSQDWVVAADDGTPEYRLAASLSSIGDPAVGDFRTHLERVKRNGDRWRWTDDDSSVVWSEGDLVKNLTAVLERRTVVGRSESRPHAPIRGRAAARLSDIHLYISGSLDLRRIKSLVEGLAMVNWRREEAGLGRGRVPPEMSRPYSLLKLLCLPEPLILGREEYRPKSSGNTLALLRKGDLEKACEEAGRLLRGNGLIPSTTEYFADRRTTERILSALIFPIDGMDSVRLAGLVLRKTEDMEDM